MSSDTKTLRKKSCIFGCDKLGVHVHRFPHPINNYEWYSSWVAVLSVKLQDIDPMTVYNNKRVCDYHFKPEEITAGRRVIFGAVPTLNLSGVFQSKYSPQREHNYASLISAGDSSVSQQSSVCVGQSFEQMELVQGVKMAQAIVMKLWQVVVPEKVYNKNKIAEIYALDSKHVHTNFDSQPSTSQTVLNTENVVLGQKNTMECSNPLSSSENIKDDLKKDCRSGSKRKSPALVPQTHKRQIRNLKKEVSRLRKKVINYSERLSTAKKLSNDIAFQRVSEKMTAAGKTFTQMQFLQTCKKPKGRRFTVDEKVLSLSLFKKSPKCYTLLSKYFTLPSAKALKTLLSQVRIGPGINETVFDQLKKTVSDMKNEDCLCTLIFDEMSITPQVHYNSGTDELKGFVNYGEENKLADHALVFMVKGIRKNYKQPVAYYFTQALKKNELKKMVKDVITNVQHTGLIILCTVCDQSTINVSTINSLLEDTKADYLQKGKEWRKEYFEVNKKTIIPLYDVPHLLKGIRNNLLNKDLKYVDINGDKKEKTLKWDYFRMLYEADKSYGELRYLQKITEEHINPEKLKKMRVKTAAQIFSRSIAVAAEHITARGDLPEECRQIVPFVLMVDNLFDSLNTSSFHVPNGKVYKGAVRKNSPHHRLWYDAKKFLESIRYVIVSKEKDGNKVRIVERCVPSVKNFIKTIEGMLQICKILHEKYLFDSILTRNFNQDPIENFFGNIRSLGVRNVSPNSISFEGSYKALLLNNFNSPHAYNSNCEEDVNACLQKLDFFVRDKRPDKIEKNDEIIINENLESLFTFPVTEENKGTEQREYVCGWVLTKCLKNVVKSCENCKQTLFSTNPNDNKYIKLKEYHQTKRWLCYPSQKLKECFYEIQKLTVNTLKHNTNRRKLKTNIKMLADMLIVFPFNCSIHKEKLQSFFLDTTINVIVYSWCRGINRILAGKITYDGDDELKKAAQIYYNKHCKQNK